MPTRPWSGAGEGGKVRVIPRHCGGSEVLCTLFAEEITPTGGELRIWDISCRFHDRIKTDPACADGARRPPVPRHHLGGLGVYLAGHKIPAWRIAAADAARRHRRDRRAAAGG